MQTNKLTVSTWNLCLGLVNKKNIVKNYIENYNIDIFNVQEIDTDSDYPNRLLSFPGYNIEVESNEVKSRVATYIKDNINYNRRPELEGKNSNLLIIDIEQEPRFRIINIYRSFNPQGGMHQKEKFRYQLQLIKNAINTKTMIVGDFNVDDGKRLDVDYAYSNYFNDIDETFSEFGFIQMIDFVTWSRVVNNVLKSSVLDHLYVRDATIINDIRSCKPCFGDHLLVMFSVGTTAQTPKRSLKRDWRKYSKLALCQGLEGVDWDVGVDTVQEYWNIFENKLINVVDRLIPITEFENNKVKHSSPPPIVKNWLNTRQRLLKIQNNRPDPIIKSKIKSLDLQIRAHFRKQKTNDIRRSIKPGNSKSLWQAVKTAKNINPETIPTNLTYNAITVPPNSIPDSFADFFEKKVNDIHNEAKIDPSIYNGNRKVNSDSKFFMSESDIVFCIKSIKIKNCEGVDRIPQRVLVDGMDHLIIPLTYLFKLIYVTKKLPEQWLMAKVSPIHKKGIKTDITNYRPISNLCSTSKIFEKLILKRMSEIELECGADITGKEQHGFKKSRSTATAGLTIQSLIARALDAGECSIMASVDLTAAFDVVNIDLLVRRLAIMGMPGDVIELIEIWLRNRSYHVEVNGEVSTLRFLLCGVVQGSILGPILYAIYVSPLFDLIDLINFADDNFVVRWNKQIKSLIAEIERDLKIMVDWLKGSGLKVNEAKTEVCLFHRHDIGKVEINLNNCRIKSMNQMNVLGVIFDSKLNWTPQVNQTITKSKTALHAIRLIRPYFSAVELQQIITSNFYSILFYNSKIWQLPTLSPPLKQKLLSASGNALKLCTPYCQNDYSFITLHNLNKRATPSQMVNYKLALQLYKTFNTQQPPLEWAALNENINTNRRQVYFETIHQSRTKIGHNFLSNRFKTLNRQIPLEWLNNSIDTFKIKCKTKFLAM